MKLVKSFALFFLVLITCTAFCQHELGIKANAGVSSIYNYYNPSNRYIKNYFRPSAQVGVFYRYQINEKSSIGTELFLTPINGKDYWWGGFYMSSPTNSTYYRHFYYIGFPVYVGYNIRKLNINLGPQFNFNVANKTVEYFSWDQNSVSYTFYNDGYRIVDVGARAGAIYSLSKKLSFEINAYWGIMSLFRSKRIFPKKEDRGNALRVRQVTLGVRYTLFSNDKKKKK